MKDFLLKLIADRLDKADEIDTKISTLINKYKGILKQHDCVFKCETCVENIIYDLESLKK